jgi:hypothetical protein
MVNRWKRSMSITPTSAIAAPKSSGCWVMLAPTSRPPFERPLIAILAGRVQPDAASQRAHAAKSSNTRCLLSRRPASCQAVPYSEPPRSDATASRPPRSIQASHSALNVGPTATWKPP